MIVSKLMGGMGNQMFQWALGRALAVKHNVPLKLDLTFLLDRTPRENFTFRDYDLDVFQLKADFAKEADLARFFPSDDTLKSRVASKLLRTLTGGKKVIEPHFHFAPQILQLEDNVYLDGYWQTPRYFEQIEDLIRNDFKFQKKMSDESLKLADEIQDKNSVCVNVRRADFVSNPEASKFHGVIGVDYLYAGLDTLKASKKDLHVYVFSDDVTWCQENIKSDLPIQFVTHEHKGFKFASYLELMSLCKNFVIPNSSFAWWAAWLSQASEKMVIAPKAWFAGSDADTSDLVPGTWIRI